MLDSSPSMTDPIPILDVEQSGRSPRCIRCGYDLRGQDGDSGRCPECGLKAYWSLRAPQKLSQYPPAWVRRMARATWLLLAAYGGMFTVLVVSSALPDLADEEVLLAAFAPASGLQLVGMWMLSSWSGKALNTTSTVNIPP